MPPVGFPPLWCAFPATARSFSAIHQAGDRTQESARRSERRNSLTDRLRCACFCVCVLHSPLCLKVGVQSCPQSPSNMPLRREPRCKPCARGLERLLCYYSSALLPKHPTALRFQQDAGQDARSKRGRCDRSKLGRVFLPFTSDIADKRWTSGVAGEPRVKWSDLLERCSARECGSSACAAGPLLAAIGGCV